MGHRDGRDKLVGIGEFVRWYAKQRGFTQRELAKKLSMTHGSLNNIMAGHYLFPQKFITKIKPLLSKEESDILLEAIHKDITGWYYAEEVYPPEER